MSDLAITSSNVVKGANAKTRRGTAGTTITAGQVIYEDFSDGGKLKLADNNASAATAKAAGIALNGAAANQPVEYVYSDDDFGAGGTLAVGTIYVLSSTAGGIAPAADLSSGMIPVVLFIAKSTSRAVLEIVRGTAAVL